MFDDPNLVSAGGLAPVVALAQSCGLGDFGHVRQLDSVAAAFLTALANSTPLLPGADQVTYLDLDDTMREAHGYAKQGAGYGYNKIKGLNALLAMISLELRWRRMKVATPVGPLH
ncbi:hypothetical protein [Geodermatophilus sp. TF02-6]|uniref:hypothetical protein n=1 Tax=Geodermatophilus sp. TF02-6 TaxID=2250575 RepID=UPI0018F7C2D4|nr:hypothetical protein [Geodermatophilus sp. TF02-6]